MFVNLNVLHGITEYTFICYEILSSTFFIVPRSWGHRFKSRLGLIHDSVTINYRDYD